MSLCLFIIKAQRDNKESNYETVWVKEHGLWRLNSEDSYVKKEKKTESSKQSKLEKATAGTGLDFVLSYEQVDNYKG